MFGAGGGHVEVMERLDYFVGIDLWLLIGIEGAEMGSWKGNLRDVRETFCAAWGREMVSIEAEVELRSVKRKRYWEYEVLEGRRETVCMYDDRAR
jgi:hypothetical protein